MKVIGSDRTSRAGIRERPSWRAFLIGPWRRTSRRGGDGERRACADRGRDGPRIAGFLPRAPAGRAAVLPALMRTGTRSLGDDGRGTGRHRAVPLRRRPRRHAPRCAARRRGSDTWVGRRVDTDPASHRDGAEAPWPRIPSRMRGGRLAGIAWDPPEAIRAEIGALTTRDRGGALRHPLAQVRSLIRLAAAAARVAAIDAACPPGGDFADEVDAAWSDGFEAKLVLEPDQAGFVTTFDGRFPAPSTDG